MQKIGIVSYFLRGGRFNSCSIARPGRMVWQRKNQGGMADKKHRTKANKKKQPKLL